MKGPSEGVLETMLQELEEQDNFVFLDSSKDCDCSKKSMLFRDPLNVLRFYSGDNVESFFTLLQSQLSAGYYLAGWVSYEFGCFLEEKLFFLQESHAAQDEPLVEMGVYLTPKMVTCKAGELKDHEMCVDTEWEGSKAYTITDLSTNMDFPEYKNAIDRIKEYIVAGDTYQVNYTLKLKFAFSGSPESFYRDLRRNQSVPYGALMRFSGKYCLSYSPELFFSKNKQKISMRPMKGTMKKGNQRVDVAANAEFLASDEKNRSENVMIVDLLRNDLGRLLHGHGGGRVEVETLFEVEEYETLLQMTSTISGIKRPDIGEDVTVEQLFRALFPCGSITGAPKIRTMEIIHELEKEKRGVYTGAIGYLSPDGDAIFNVPIRTVVIEKGKGEMGIGSGIVHDSQVESEWDECLLKAKFLTGSMERFQLLATILWCKDLGGFFLLDNHMDRLYDSAAYFHFRLDKEALEALLRQKDGEYNQEEVRSMRLKVLISKNGKIDYVEIPCSPPKSITIPPLHQETASLPSIALHGEQVDTDSPWFYHKTTRRPLFDSIIAQALKKDLADICFVNDRGEVTEGCISNLIVYMHGCYFTPKLSCGLLPGVMRAHLLGLGQIVERVISEEEMRKADALFLCNGIRGVRQVRLAE